MSETQMQIYARARGGTTPPLLMNPNSAWTVKTFTRLALRSLGVKLDGDVAAYQFSLNVELSPDTVLGEAGLLPYEMVEFRSRV